MAQQHVFTSAPQGLKPGTRGFTTVGASRDLSSTLIGRLELLSGYTLPSAQPAASPDAKEKFNPVNYMHVKLTIGGDKHTLVSRIAPAGVDYTGRSNTLAHHLIVAKNEESPAGPAWLAMQSGLLLTQWTGQPRQLPSVQIPPGLVHGKPCTTWAKVMGDSSYAGSLVTPIINQPGRPIVLIHTPEQAPDIPAMLFEALAILPSQLRWDVTFSTYFTSAAPDVHCRVRCILSTDPLAEQVRRVASVVLLDLTQKTNGRPIPGEPFETCRKGGTWPDLSPANDVSEETSDKVHPAAAKMLRAKPVPQIQDLLLAELSADDPSGVHPPAPAPPSEHLARSRAARKNDSTSVKNMAIGGAVVVGSIAALTIGAYFLFSASTPAPTVEPFEELPTRAKPVATPTPADPAPTPTVAPSQPPLPGPSSGGRYAVTTVAPSVTSPADLPPTPAVVGSSSSNAPFSTTGTSAGITSSNVLGAMNWGDVEIYDGLNTFSAKYTGAAASLPPNQSQPLVYQGNTLVAKFAGPFPKIITDATSFDVIINLPGKPRGLRSTILRDNPTVLEITKPDTELASQSILARLTIAKRKDNSLIELQIDQGTIPLSDLAGTSILLQPTTGNFDGKQDDWRKTLLLAALSDPATEKMSIDVPIYTTNFDKSNPPINSVQASQFARLGNWRLALSTQPTASGWSDFLLSSPKTPGNNDLSPDATFTPFIRQASIDNPQPQVDVIVRTGEIKSLWDIRRELGKRKATADASRAKLKELLEKLNAVGTTEEKDNFKPIPPHIPPADVVTELDANGKRGISGTLTQSLGSLLAEVKTEARKAKDDDFAYQTSLKTFNALTQNMVQAKYEGLDVFGNVAATVTFNIIKTSETSQPVGRSQAVSNNPTDSAPATASPSTDTPK
jgi:hypothetical protein